MASSSAMDDYIQPYAVRYRRDDDDDDGSNLRTRATAAADATDATDMKPYAVAYAFHSAYSGQNDAAFPRKRPEKKQARNPDVRTEELAACSSTGVLTNSSENEANIPASVGEDKDIQKIRRCKSVLHANPMYSNDVPQPNALRANPMYSNNAPNPVPQARCGCGYRRVCVAVTAAVLVCLVVMATLAGVYFSSDMENVSKVGFANRSLEKGGPTESTIFKNSQGATLQLTPNGPRGATPPLSTHNPRGATPPSTTHGPRAATPPLTTHSLWGATRPSTTHSPRGATPPLTIHSPRGATPPLTTNSLRGATPPLTTHSPRGATPPLTTNSLRGATPPLTIHSPRGATPPLTTNSLRGATPPLTTHSPRAATPPLTTNSLRAATPPLTTNSLRGATPPLTTTSSSSLLAQSNGDDMASPITIGKFGREPGDFNGCRAAVVSADNEIFVADYHNRRIQVFSMKAAFLREFPTVVPERYKTTMRPGDVAIDGEGRLWVVGKYNYNIYVVQYSYKGQPVTEFEPPCPPYHRHNFPSIAADLRNHKLIVATQPNINVLRPNVSLHHTFKNVRGHVNFVASDNDGRILVTDNWHTVLVYNLSGQLLSSFTRFVGDQWLLHGPTGIFADASGHIVVANQGKHRVDMFTLRGQFIRTVVNVTNPSGIAMAPGGQLVVCNQGHNKLTIFPRRMVLL